MEIPEKSSISYIYSGEAYVITARSSADALTDSYTWDKRDQVRLLQTESLLQNWGSISWCSCVVWNPIIHGRSSWIHRVQVYQDSCGGVPVHDQQLVVFECLPAELLTIPNFW